MQYKLVPIDDGVEVLVNQISHWAKAATYAPAAAFLTHSCSRCNENLQSFRAVRARLRLFGTTGLC